MAVTIKKKRGIPHPSEPLKVCSIKLPATALHLLHNLSQEASDSLGRPVTSSTLLRVLLEYLSRQPSSWVGKELHPLIEEEIEQGRLWGSKGKHERKTVSAIREFLPKSSARTFRAKKG